MTKTKMTATVTAMSLLIASPTIAADAKGHYVIYGGLDCASWVYIWNMDQPGSPEQVWLEGFMTAVNALGPAQISQSLSLSPTFPPYMWPDPSYRPQPAS